MRHFASDMFLGPSDASLVVNQHEPLWIHPMHVEHVCRVNFTSRDSLKLICICHSGGCAVQAIAKHLRDAESKLRSEVGPA